MKARPISHARKPEDMTLIQWQTALRRQAGRAAAFRLKNLGREPIFSDFHVTNPESGQTYRVAVRGAQPGQNYCSCPDYAINTFGTCKHIEFVLGRLERQRGAQRTLAAGYHPRYSEVYLRYGVKREVVFRPGLDCPAKLKTQAAHFFDAEGLLKPAAYGGIHEFLALARRSKHETRIYEDALACIAQVQAKVRLRERVEALFPEGVESPGLATLVKVPLYPYQRHGALFAARAGRSLIADDMGLGKTVQAVAATEVLARAVGLQRVLVVAPTSLKYQWKQEIETFSTRPVEVIEGGTVERARGFAGAAFFTITTYDLVHRDFDAICAWAPGLIILDEAQRIKNWKTRTAQTVKRLPSDYAIVLSGTPLENRLEELHSIVEFVDRAHLGPRFRFLAEHQEVDDSGRVVGYRNLSQIARTLKTILIRRTKDEVLKELPERREKRLFLTMTKAQWALHEENREVVARIVAKWRRLGFLSDRDQRLLMSALQNMRMVCNSTYLLDPATDDGNKVPEALAVIEDLLEQPDAKIVAFSQWVRTHKLLAKRLKARGRDAVLFHGGVPGRTRRDLIRKFKDDPASRIFLSTDAGSVGLNLQHATAVLNMDQPWNPAVLEQRIGRVHRLGQRRPVLVYHFIAEHSIEHGMLSLLSFKKSLFAGVLDGGQENISLGGTRLTRFMQSVEQATSAGPPAKRDERPASPLTEVSAQASVATASSQADAGPVADGSDQARWKALLAAGRSLLDAIEGAVVTGTGASQPYLKLPLPSAEVVTQIVQLLGSLTGGRR